MARYGMTVPLDGIPLHEQRDWFREMVDLGYTDFWSSEAGGYDGFTPLALASAWTPTARLGIAIIPAYTRGPGLLAMSVASLAAAAPRAEEHAPPAPADLPVKPTGPIGLEYRVAAQPAVGVPLEITVTARVQADVGRVTIEAAVSSTGESSRAAICRPASTTPSEFSSPGRRMTGERRSAGCRAESVAGVGVNGNPSIHILSLR